MPEITVGVRELEAQLGHYLREVKGGATLVITDHGEPVGQLVPPVPTLEQKLKRLVADGVGAWDGRKLAPKVPKAELLGSKTVAEILLEDRE